MSIVQSINTLNEFALTKLQIIWPTLTAPELTFYSLFTCAVGALLLALYGMIFRTKTTKDVENAYANGYQSGKAKANAAASETIQAQARKIDDLQHDDLFEESENRQLKETLEKANQTIQEQNAQLDRIANTPSAETYRLERVISELARDLEGYDEIQTKAERIVETLH